MLAISERSRVFLKPKVQLLLKGKGITTPFFAKANRAENADNFE
jgi:hypothetical protein